MAAALITGGFQCSPANPVAVSFKKSAYPAMGSEVAQFASSVVVAIKRTSVFEVNLRYFSGAWIADISCVAFVVVAVRKPALALAVFLSHVPKLTNFC
jgi:hypothetical protein